MMIVGLLILGFICGLIIGILLCEFGGTTWGRPPKKSNATSETEETKNTTGD